MASRIDEKLDPEVAGPVPAAAGSVTKLIGYLRSEEQALSDEAARRIWGHSFHGCSPWPAAMSTRGSASCMTRRMWSSRWAAASSEGCAAAASPWPIAMTSGHCWWRSPLPIHCTERTVERKLGLIRKRWE